jgi:hypothetical protein
METGVRSPSAVVSTAVFACQRLQRSGLLLLDATNAVNPNKRKGGLVRIEKIIQPARGARRVESCTGEADER